MIFIKNEIGSISSDPKHSSKLIILSKQRLSSAKNPSTLLVCQEGNVKIRIKIQDSINKQKIDSTLKNMKLKQGRIKNSRSDSKIDTENNQNKNSLFKKKFFKNYSKINFDKPADPENLVIKENINYDTNRNYNTTGNEEKNINKNNEKKFQNDSDETIEREEMKDDVIFNVDSFKYNENNQLKKYNSSNLNNVITNNSFEKKIHPKMGMKKNKNSNSNYEGIQPSDKAAISEQDNITDFDKRTKIIPKFVYETHENGNSEINEDELENESINNKENLITESKKDVINSCIGSIDNKEDQLIKEDTIKKEEDKKSSNKSEDTVKIVSEDVIVEKDDDEKDRNIIGNINNYLVKNKDNNNDENDNNKNQQSNFNNIQNTIIFNKKKNVEKEESKKISTTPNQENENNKIQAIFFNNNIKNSQNLIRMNYNYKNCSICEHSYPLSKLYVADCETHYLCRKCCKNYYEDAIENGAKNLYCPFRQCKQFMNLDILKNIISQEHFSILTNHNNTLTDNSTDGIKHPFYCAKLKTAIDNENLKKYTKKHVLDINSNKNFFNYNCNKDIFCPNCYEESLFSKTNTHFIKCLNCCCKKCKYCMKEFNDKHMDINTEKHCTVYYRLEDEDFNKKNKCLELLLQYFFVFACFYFMFVGSFLNISRFFKRIFNTNRESNFTNVIKLVFVYIFTVVIFIVIIPVIILFYPYFPYILAFSDIP